MATSETALGIVRLYGLYRSSHSSKDLTCKRLPAISFFLLHLYLLRVGTNVWFLYTPDGSETGILVSQLEIDFACISACVPTILRTLDEALAFFVVHILRLPYHGSTGVKSSFSGKTTIGSGHIHLSNLHRSSNRDDPRIIHGPYSSLDKGVRGGSPDSWEHITNEDKIPSKNIKVQHDYCVTEEPSE